MKELITGKNGQLGWELLKTAPEGVEDFAFGRSELDITNAVAVHNAFEKVRPEVIINTAAYTAIDTAESEKEQCFEANHIGPPILAEACLKFDARLLHISTDFVFDGNKTTPYKIEDDTNPLSIYGASKLAGEKAVMETSSQNLVVRTSWVYSAHGNNFVKTMLKLIEQKEQLGIVYDQVGTPTWGARLAKWLWQVAEKEGVAGIYHWTDAGVASWYDFAVAIQELAFEKKVLSKKIPIRPIPATSYPTPAIRPSFSVLDKASAETAAGLNTVHWRTQLSSMLDSLILT